MTKGHSCGYITKVSNLPTAQTARAPIWFVNSFYFLHSSFFRQLGVFFLNIAQRLAVREAHASFRFRQRTRCRGSTRPAARRPGPSRGCASSPSPTLISPSRSQRPTPTRPTELPERSGGVSFFRTSEGGGAGCSFFKFLFRCWPHTLCASEYFLHFL